MKTHDERIAEMNYASVYPHYLNKVEKKGRTKAELDEVISWLTGFDNGQLHSLIAEKVNFKIFFHRASLHPHTSQITGLICGTVWKRSLIH